MIDDIEHRNHIIHLSKQRSPPWENGRFKETGSSCTHFFLGYGVAVCFFGWNLCNQNPPLKEPPNLPTHPCVPSMCAPHTATSNLVWLRFWSRSWEGKNDPPMALSAVWHVGEISHIRLLNYLPLKEQHLNIFKPAQEEYPRTHGNEKLGAFTCKKVFVRSTSMCAFTARC